MRRDHDADGQKTRQKSGRQNGRQIANFAQVKTPSAASSVPIFYPDALATSEYASSPLLLTILRIAVDLFEILARQLVMGIDPQGALKMQLGLGELARFGQSAAQVGLGVSIVRTQADGNAIVLYCCEESCLAAPGARHKDMVWLRRFAPRP